MASYRLTKAADADVDQLFIFGFITFGINQADAYVTGLYDCLDGLAANPQHWPAVDDIRPGLRRCVYGSHSVYYRIDPGEIVIVRILGREEPKTQLRREE